jgi:hypothetical protein
VTVPVPEIALRASRRARLFAIALMATILVAVLPLPWRLSGLGFGGVAAYAGIVLLRDLAALRRAGRPAPGWLGVGVGLGLTSFLLLLYVGQAALYPLLAEQERCLARAVTHLDAAHCRTAFEQRQQEILRRFDTRPTPS